MLLCHTRVLCAPAAGMSTEAFSDYVVGHGELWSAQLFSLCCKQLGADVQ